MEELKLTKGDLNVICTAEAWSVYKETNLTPHQLLEQRNELLVAAMTALLAMTDGIDIPDNVPAILRDALTKVEKTNG